ncbi:NAD(P)H-dependent flavin oxidoreductase [Actinoplanes auranticolor]|uniref:2-nitropropane dioxygenase n=1 Tax=Actinoplanes auranticolor TaxID=47988 RepID=A0A919SUW4_9ACTN|nr:nitronate monooxygenase [Actinoplanes auranticolor]GIM77478.1 2-nitropropane dioxygenase [Actinoplanes auranticolor]
MTGGIRTPLCERLGIDVPIVQAPVGSAAGPELAAAVADAGGLGMLAVTWLGAEQARDGIRRVRRLTPRPFGVNLVLDFPVADTLDRCLAEGVPVVSTFWGDPGAVSGQIRAAGALHMHTVGGVAEAVHAAGCGVDIVVAQGWEAGGHVRGTTTTMVLVPAVVDAVAPVPVLAAGGISDGRGLAAALALGAQGAWLGTRFLASAEARSHPVHRQHLVDAGAEDTVHTHCFDDGWPGAAHRALRNGTLRRWEQAGSPSRPERPGEGDVVAVDGTGRAHHRYGDQIPLPGMTGDLTDLALYAGQSVELVRAVEPAGELIRRIAAQATAARPGAA